jgi:hypothetical protein
MASSINDSDTIEQQEKKKKKQLDTVVKHKIAFENNVMLIKPTHDASDKEIHLRNDMGFASKNLLEFIANDENNHYRENIFQPEKLGNFTRDNVGTVKNVNVTRKKPDFSRNPGDPLKKKRLKPPLAPIKEELETNTTVLTSKTPTTSMGGKISELGKTPTKTPKPAQRKKQKQWVRVDLREDSALDYGSMDMG